MFTRIRGHAYQNKGACLPELVSSFFGRDEEEQAFAEADDVSVEEFLQDVCGLVGVGFEGVDQEGGMLERGLCQVPEDGLAEFSVLGAEVGRGVGYGYGRGLR